MTTFDNGEPMDGWTVTPKHCGQICFIRDCPTCGVTVNPHVPIPDNIVLGSE